MKNLSLATKTASGFTVILLLLIVVSFFSWKGIASITEGVVGYRDMANETNLASRLQANMLMVQMNVKNFIITGSKTELEEYQVYLNKMNTFLEQSQKEITDPERAEKISGVTEIFQTYQTTFQRIIEIRKERDQLVNNKINIIGPQLGEQTTEILASSNIDNDLLRAFSAAKLQKRILLGRLHVIKFLETNSTEEANRVLTEFNYASEDIAMMLSLVDKEEHVELVMTLHKEIEEYLASFEQLVQIINERNTLITGTLDKLGPQIGTMVEEVILSVKAEQDNLGPKLEKKSFYVITEILIISCVALIFGILITFFLTRAITVPIREAVKFVHTIASGDFTSQLSVKNNDEIGSMTKAMNTMVVDLNQMVKDIIEGVATLSTSSDDLTVISEKLLSASHDSTEKSEAVAAAAEEMNTNISSVSAAMEQSSANTGMVASATEEMSSTIGKIGDNTEKAKTVSMDAVSKSEAASAKMEELGKSAERIGKVTETITEISEQTNLLALNATIEAARAGEAGKGFAVVANEIKDLASQTADATVDIKNQIENMQNTTQATVQDMNGISQVISDINQVVNDIAEEVEQQTAVTAEISSNVVQVAEGIGEVNENVAQSSMVVTDITKEIIQVNQAAQEVNSGSGQVQTSAEKLSQLSEQLDAMIQRFKV